MKNSRRLMAVMLCLLLSLNSLFAWAEPTEENSRLYRVSLIASDNSVGLGDGFTTNIRVKSDTETLYHAYRLELEYDADLYEYTGVESQNGLEVKQEGNSLVLLRMGSGLNCSKNDTDGDQIQLNWQAKAAGTGSIQIVSAHVDHSDNAPVQDTAVADIETGSVEVTVVSSEEPVDFAIVNHPVDYEGPIGSVGSFHVDATGEGLTYQWYYTRSGKNWYKSDLVGNQTDTVEVPFTKTRVGQMYRCEVSDKYGNRLTSEIAVMREVDTTLKILEQPTDARVYIGDIAVFTVAAQGQGLSYQWYYSNNGGKKWYKSGLTGNQTDTMQVPVTNARIGQMYRCKVTDQDGAQVTSEAAVIVQKVKGVVITLQPADISGAVNETADFHVEAEGEGLTYRWYYSKDGGMKWYVSTFSGNDTDTVSVPIKSFREGQMYRCKIQSEDGTVVTSEAATLHVQ